MSIKPEEMTDARRIAEKVRDGYMADDRDELQDWVRFLSRAFLASSVVTRADVLHLCKQWIEQDEGRPLEEILDLEQRCRDKLDKGAFNEKFIAMCRALHAALSAPATLAVHSAPAFLKFDEAGAEVPALPAVQACSVCGTQLPAINAEDCAEPACPVDPLSGHAVPAAGEREKALEEAALLVETGVQIYSCCRGGCRTAEAIRALKTSSSAMTLKKPCARCGDPTHTASEYHNACDVCGSKDHSTEKHETAPQPSTAGRNAGPSQEGLGQGEAAGAASPSTTGRLDDAERRITEMIRHIGVRAGVSESTYGAMCHEARCILRSVEVDAEIQSAPTSSAMTLNQDDVQWVVNDIAELGVKIGDQFFWMYKGGSLVYGTDDDNVKDGIVQHDDGGNMHWRPVFKREFGECCHPVNYADLRACGYPHLIGTVSLQDSDEWKPLPCARVTDRKEV